MISQSIRRFFVIPLLFLPPLAAGSAADTDGAAGRTFSYFDKNKDSKLDSGEISKLPTTMRDWLAKNSPDSKNGLLKPQFLAIYPKMMAKLRQRTRIASSDTGETRAGDAGEPKNKTGPKVKRRNSKPGKPLLYASDPPPDDVVESPRTSNLPSEYEDADFDRDGQIDYFEWRKAKLGEFARFKELDLNSDSVLSVLELGAAGAPSDDSSSTTASTNTANSDTTPSKTSTASKSSSGGPSKEYLEGVKKAFYYMDGQGEKYGTVANSTGNKNGKMDPHEWKVSARIKPAFERAKIDISKPMDFKTFTTHYMKVFPEKTRSNSRSKDRNRDSKDRKSRKRFKRGR